MHLKHENNQIIEFPIMNLSQYLPNTSLPVDLTIDENLPEGFAYVQYGDIPQYDAQTQKLIQKTAPDFDGKRWYLNYEVTPLSESEIAAYSEQKLAISKASRHIEIDNISITTQSGLSFDGDEDSQNRMARAIIAMSDTDTIQWVLSNNTIATVTKAELQEALRLAGIAMAEIWVRPYINQ